MRLNNLNMCLWILNEFRLSVGVDMSWVGLDIRSIYLVINDTYILIRKSVSCLCLLLVAKEKGF